MRTFILLSTLSPQGIQTLREIRDRFGDELRVGHVGHAGTEHGVLDGEQLGDSRLHARASVGPFPPGMKRHSV